MSSKELLKESDIDTKVKEYFKKVEGFAGSDYAIVSALAENNLKDSLTLFSSSFDGVSNAELTFSFLKSAILSEESDNKYVETFLNLEDFGSLAFLINENKSVRKSIVKGLVSQCGESFETTYSKSQNQEKVLEQLSKLKEYEDTFNVAKEPTYLRLRNI